MLAITVEIDILRIQQNEKKTEKKKKLVLTPAAPKWNVFRTHAHRRACLIVCMCVWMCRLVGVKESAPTNLQCNKMLKLSEHTQMGILYDLNKFLSFSLYPFCSDGAKMMKGDGDRRRYICGTATAMRQTNRLTVK